ncbi:MAG: sulfatase [Pirellulaceae bacterium]|nr:MAG: sulfatase [Pirellulaceae bacterium]GIX00854.1 MAG: sulfatase [Pirellulaceae bacterium]GIX01005.1 MAG: sulfatase [Pirellulaceae bacterium]
MRSHKQASRCREEQGQFVEEQASALQLLRRNWLMQSACGFAGVAATALGAGPAGAAETGFAAALSRPHHRPRAKRVIFLFMQGGVSQVDSFDYKPLLARRHGEEMEFDDARQLAKTGQRTRQRLMQSPWKFRPYGECGRMVSDLFPETARHVDDLCFLHGMHTEGVAHGPATLFLHCGATNFVRPSVGSWIYYGLGTENADLPGFVTIAPSLGNGGPRNYGAAFLPPRYQGTKIGSAGARQLTMAGLGETQTVGQTETVELLRALNVAQRRRRDPAVDEFDAALQSVDLAWRTQRVAPEILDLERETAATWRLYGMDDPHTRSFGEKCLLARRLCEQGVRFIQVNYGDNSANPAWDQHSNLPKHAEHARAVDRPIAGLLTDLKQRGLLDDTIVWWGGEFGRTPYSQDNGTGRDHNPGGFTVWLAGGGFKPGFAFGRTDEFGFQGIEGKVHMHDLHATLLYQLGLDHERLTYRYAGRDFRLTDVYGRVIKEVLA